jgi:hypothetical protein
MPRKLLIAVLVFVLALPALSSGAQEGCEEVVTIRVDDWSSGDRVEYMQREIVCQLNFGTVRGK